MSMEFRKLIPSDASEFYRLRLIGLQDSPKAFGESDLEFKKRSIDSLAAKIKNEYEENGSFIIGAFDAEQLLVGIMGLRRQPAVKRNHIANIWGVYVASSQRGRGLGRKLIETTIKEAKTLPGLEKIHLSVGEYNLSAIKLYKNAGFEIFGNEKKAMKIGTDYVDDFLMVMNLLQTNI